MAQQERHDDAAEQRPQLPPAVADAKEGLIDQPGRAGPLHGIDDEADAGNHGRVVLQRHAGAETAEHGIMSGNRALHRLPVGDIADNHPQIFVVDRKLVQRANEGTHRMALCQRRLDKDASRRARGAEDQQFHGQPPRTQTGLRPATKVIGAPAGPGSNLVSA